MPAAKKTAAPKTTAAKAEATEKPVKFTHLGIEFEVPPAKKLPLDLLFAEDELDAVKIVVGEDKWAEFRAARPTIGDFQDLSIKVNEASAGSGN
ncbi:hypothetical protein H9W91_07290 [Streptomyces alfalfae]|uniref:hypothetical protein n=1 Tax=Streptomyces alfalfae TaxID=1642299 RepID=UPI001BA92EB8|nr:hypothetical protein [Streptomyces alfalfae]QUI30683.1 hypothetical protein H9W91_07290 [Streptomyces alfalfae]